MFGAVVIASVLLAFDDVTSKELFNNVYYKDVEINTGTVRGFLDENANYFAFLGVPYAAAPVGNLRFKAPIPPDSWENIYIANNTVKCPQNGIGDENCLIVNVFTPATFHNGPLSVLVYIHGGSFLIGSGQTKGVEPLIEQNVIVVTLNYRLGALGFLCLGIEEAPGNAGLKDQVAALKWVQRNIDKFGGDPDQVTIYGMSAGGTSAEMLVFSKAAEGLFHNAIVESGAASAVWSLDADPRRTATELAKSLYSGKNITDVYELLNYYQKMPAKELSEVNYKYYQNLTDGTFGFVPCLERKLLNIDPFLINTPNDILRKIDYNKVPMMFIFATLEGLYLRSSDYYELNYKQRMNADFKDFLPADLIFDSEEIRDEIADKVKQFYFGHEPIGDNTLTGYFDYFGDHLILNGLLNSAVAHSKNGDVVYLMEFAHKGKLGYFDKFFDNINKARHGDAIKHVILNNQIENKDDLLAVKRMSKIVTNFMKYGTPSPARSELIPIFWPAVQQNQVSYLRMCKELQVLKEPFWERKVFWDKLYETYRRPV